MHQASLKLARLGLALLLGLGGLSCLFESSPPAVYSCSTEHPECPAGLVCRASRCVAPGDARVDGPAADHGDGVRVDAPVDAPPAGERRVDIAQHPDHPRPEGPHADAPLTCGNLQLDPLEECDGSSFGGKTCLSVTGKPHGVLTCVGCKINSSGCHHCGDGTPDGPEFCDGSNLNGKSCQTQGFNGGTLKCGTGCLSFDTSSCCTAPAPPTGLNPTRIVAPGGDDLKADGLCVPYKTITKALSGLTGGVVWVAPGSYAAGETFPIIIPGKVTLIGNTADHGEGPTPTKVIGSGTHYIDICTFVLTTNAQLAGISVDPTGGNYGACADAAVGANIRYCTFRGSNGVRSIGADCLGSINNSTFATSSLGIKTDCGTSTLIQLNSFGGGFAQLWVGGGKPTIDQNTFGAVGGAPSYAIYQENAGTSPTVTTNTVSAACTKSAIFIQNGSGKYRGNKFTASGQPMAVDISGGAPDFGQAAVTNAGDNVFNAQVFQYQGTASINAIGNTWNTAPPSCAQIKTPNAGKVIWGNGPADQCPP